MDEFNESGFNALVRLVEKDVRRLDSWMRQNVAGFAGIETDDRRSYANEIAWRLMTGSCRCGLAHCSQQHNLAAFPTSGMQKQEAFVYRAVIGPRGLRANSIAQGMMFPSLRDECNVRAAPVELKRCHNAPCQRQYEGNTCVHCGFVFTPDTTEMVSADWLVIEGVYLPVRRWRCGNHFFHQRLCREEVVGAFPDAQYHVVHGMEHDRCPWQPCPQGNSRHPQRGTELWVRAEFVGAQAQGGHAPPRLLDGIAEGMRRALMDLSDETRGKVLAEFGDNLLFIAEALFSERQFILTKQQLEQVRQAIRRALSEQGIDEMTIDAWLRVHDAEAEAREVIQDERQDDNP